SFKYEELDAQPGFKGRKFYREEAKHMLPMARRPVGCDSDLNPLAIHAISFEHCRPQSHLFFFQPGTQSVKQFAESDFNSGRGKHWLQAWQLLAIRLDGHDRLQWNRCATQGKIQLPDELCPESPPQGSAWHVDELPDFV